MPTSSNAATRSPMAVSLTELVVVGLMNLPLLRALALPLGLSATVTKEEPDVDDASLWIYLSIALALVLLGGIFAGLTIALMGQDGMFIRPYM